MIKWGYTELGPDADSADFFGAFPQDAKRLDWPLLGLAAVKGAGFFAGIIGL